MKHKAYVFDYDNFTLQLCPTLIDALKNNNKENLINFIQHNIETLKDPDNISTADEVWQKIRQGGNINELGDLALTKFYAPDEDIGLNYEWWNIERILKTEKTLDSHTIHLSNCIVYVLYMKIIALILANLVRIFNHRNKLIKITKS